MKKLLLVLAAGLFSLTGWALDLDTAKMQGLVGEQANGYLGLVANHAEAEALIKEINVQRKIKYQEIAVKRGSDLSVVEKFAGSKLIEKAQADKQFYQNENGKWAR